MIVALTSGQKLGLAGVAAVFIVFALVSSFALPARNPDFPGRRLPLFIGVTALLFVAMITAVLTLAIEDEEESHAAEPGAAETETGAETGGAAETQPAAGGDAAAGERVFASAGCGACHALEEAGATGTIGPSLDELDAPVEDVVEQVTNGGGGMPPFGDRLSEEQIQDVAAFVVASGG